MTTEAKAGVPPLSPHASYKFHFIRESLSIQEMSLVDPWAKCRQQRGRGAPIPRLPGHICVCAQMHMCVQKLTDKLWCHSRNAIFFFPTVSQRPRTSHAGYTGWRLSPWDPPISASRPWDYRYTLACLAIFTFFKHRFRVIKLRSSYQLLPESQISPERGRGHPEKQMRGYRGRRKE